MCYLQKALDWITITCSRRSSAGKTHSYEVLFITACTQSVPACLLSVLSR